MSIEGLPGKFVDKVTCTLSNIEMAKKDIKQKFQEFKIGTELYHENIVKYKYFMRLYDPARKKHETHLIIEYCDGGNLGSFIKRSRKLTIEQIQRIGGQLISGINHLHKKKIIHQDIKPGNVMLTGDHKQIKIIDMGVSHTLDRTFQVTESAQQGTLRYMAPEQAHDRLSLLSDIWSFGCVLLELCTGNQPYHGVESWGLCRQMQKETPLEFALRSFPREDLELLLAHQDLQEILRRCFTRDERQRPNAEAVMSEEFFKFSVVTWAL